MKISVRCKPRFKDPTTPRQFIRISEQKGDLKPEAMIHLSPDNDRFVVDHADDKEIWTITFKFIDSEDGLKDALKATEELQTAFMHYFIESERFFPEPAFCRYNLILQAAERFRNLYSKMRNCMMAASSELNQARSLQIRGPVLGHVTTAASALQTGIQHEG